MISFIVAAIFVLGIIIFGITSFIKSAGARRNDGYDPNAGYIPETGDSSYLLENSSSHSGASNSDPESFVGYGGGESGGGGAGGSFEAGSDSSNDGGSDSGGSDSGDSGGGGGGD